MATTIFLVRHGETDWNRERRIQGHSDVPLNENGRMQARALSERLGRERFDAVYSSDLARARETAQIAVAPTSLPLIELVELREKHFGSWEGLTSDVALARFPEASTGPWGDGETSDEMSARVVAALRSIAAEHDGGNVLVVTHGGPVRATLRAAGSEPAGSIENCHLSRIEIGVNGSLRRID